MSTEAVDRIDTNTALLNQAAAATLLQARERAVKWAVILQLVPQYIEGVWYFQWGEGIPVAGKGITVADAIDDFEKAMTRVAK